MLNLFAAGYCAGATAFDIKVGFFNSRLLFPGAALPQRDLRELYSYLLCSPSNPQEWALHELAIGVKAGLKRELRWVRLLLDDASFLFVGEEIHEEASGFSERTLALDLGHRRSLGSLLNRNYPESDKLKSGIWACSLPGQVNEVRPVFALEEGQGQIRCDVEEPLIYADLEDGWVSVGRKKALGRSQDSRLVMLIRGRCFEKPMKFGPGEVRALLRADDARLDLSQSAPVEGGHYLKRLAALSRRVEDLCYDWVMDDSNRVFEEAYRKVAGRVATYLRTRGRLQEALKLMGGERRVRQAVAIYHQLGEVSRAADLLSESLDESRSPHFRAAAMLDMATLLSRLDGPRALAAWAEGYALIRRLHEGRKNHYLADALESKLWWLPEVAGDLQDTLQLAETALELKKHLGQQHRRLCSTLEVACYLSIRAGEPAKALRRIERAWKIRAKVFGQGDPIVASTLTLQCLALRAIGDPEAAEKVALQRLRLIETVYGPDHPEYRASQNLLRPKEGEVICYRGWYHSRSRWSCRVPLRWGSWASAGPVSGPVTQVNR